VPGSAEGRRSPVFEAVRHFRPEAGLWLLSALVARLPARGVRALGAAVGWIAGSVLRYRREHVEDAMRRASIPDAPARARALYRALGISMVEVLSLGASPGGLSRVHLDPPSLVRWREALALGRGVVIAGSHTGNWDLAACAMARDTELLVVSKRLSVRWLDRFWQATRALRGVRLAYAENAMAAARRVLGRGGAVAMMIDQVPISARHGTDVEFLGRPALTDRAPATLAAVRRAPLVVAAGRRDDRGAQVLYVLEVLMPPRQAGRAWIEAATGAATLALDRFVREYPDQWLWLHRRWKRLDRNAAKGTLPTSCPILSSSRGAPSRAA
jgi:KDO2-lipid IV(A) lauroyltransferase